MTLSPEEQKRLLFEMLRIRKFQLKIESLYLDNEMKTPIHLYIGQEAIAVGVCANLTSEDYINSNHRSCGHYLAKGGNLKALVAELYGRVTGCSRGRGGAMHLVDTSIGHLGSSSIVGGGIPIGTGMGLAIKMKEQDRISVIFFGDGAVDEGVFYESINFAILKKLPVIYVLEDNQYSVCSRVSARQAGSSIFHAFPPKLLLSQKIDGNDVLEVYQAAREAVDRAHNGQGPSFIDCKTYRIRGHAGCESQDFKGYRIIEEVEYWKGRCPVSNYQKKLLKQGTVNQKDLDLMEKIIDNELEEAFSCARMDPLPEGKDLHLYLFCE